MASLNLYNRKADHVLYLVDCMFRMKCKAENADTFQVGETFGHIDGSIHIHGEHESNAK